MNGSKNRRLFSPRRVLIIAGSTFTQLVRMKIFYFLAPVAIVFIGLQFFDLPFYEGAEVNSSVAELKYHKTTCLGTMMLFASLFGIVSTALLIPRDIEDRTLYTILCKPVPRLDYLMGKLVGVLWVIFISMMVMNLLMVVTLHFRMEKLVSETVEILTQKGFSEDRIEIYVEALREQGPSWVLQAGVLAHFLKAAVLAGVALLVSTFSTSTLFTIAISMMVWIIGAMLSAARDFWNETGTWILKLFGSVLNTVFPNFKIYEAVADGAVRADEILLKDVGLLCGFSFFYVGIYVVLSWFVFAKKEF